MSLISTIAPSPTHGFWSRSTGSRRQLYMTYNAASGGDVYAAQQEHYRTYAEAGRKSIGLIGSYFK